MPAPSSQTSSKSQNDFGFSIIEALIAIAVASIILSLVASSLRYIRQSFLASDYKARAIALAQEALDISAEIQNHEFTCPCFSDGCSCSNAGGSCTAKPGYSSCWVDHSPNASSNTDVHLAQSSGVWHFADGPETITTDPTFVFTRSITIANLCRDTTSRALATCGTPGSDTDLNSKKIQVTMNWSESGHSKSLLLEQILTGWKNCTGGTC